MKRLIYLFVMLSIACLGNENSRNKELQELLKGEIKLFIDAPSQAGLDELIPLAKEMIELDESNPRGYLFLSQIYMNAGGVLDRREALQKAVSIVDQYQSRKDRPTDLSSLKEILSFQIKNLDEKAKLDRDTQRMLDLRNPPPVISSARALVRQYHDTAAMGSVDESLLDKTLGVLNDELAKNRLNLDVYLEISNVYYLKGDYANAYAIWQLAYQFADDKDDLALANATTRLYMVAVNYENNNEVSEKTRGMIQQNTFYGLIGSHSGEKYHPNSSRTWKC